MKSYILILLLVVNLFSNDDKVTLQLSWKNQFQFAGFYVAKEMGYYDKAGLDVDIKEYKHSIDVVDDVVSKKTTYGIGKSSLLISKSKGKPVVALAAIYQSSPSVFITTNPNIKTPADFLNKRIMVTTNEAHSASLTSMLMSNGVLSDGIILQRHSFDYNDLIQGKTDAMASYISNEPYFLEKSGVYYKVFDPKDYGYDFYGDILFTSKDEITNNPQRVKKFHNASRDGWLWAFKNIESTAKLIYEKYNTQNKSLESLIYEGYSLKKLALVENIPFGHISKKNIQRWPKCISLAVCWIRVVL
jgi:ABC-type nitrate/sulfonate/bicarbonate transport system substrate-binding protein